MAKHKVAYMLLGVVGILYVFHMWNSHGTGKAFFSGLGINR